MPFAACLKIQTKAKKKQKYDQKKKRNFCVSVVCLFRVGYVFVPKSELKWCPVVPKASPWAPDGTVGKTPATGKDLGSPEARRPELQGFILG